MAFNSSILRTGENFTLKLPKEHGAVGVFSLATILSLSLSQSHVASVACGLAILWLMMTAKDNFLLLATISFLSASILCFAGHPQAAVFVLALFCGLQLMHNKNSAKEFWWREILGLSGAVLVPLLMTALLSGNYRSILIPGNCLLAGVMTGLAIIHASRQELKIHPALTACLSFLLWLLLALQNPLLTGLCLIPFVMQVIWISKGAKPGYKALGILQIGSLFFSSIMLLLCR